MCLWGGPRQTRLGHIHVHDNRRGTFLLYWNDKRIVVFLKRVGSLLSISYKVTHFYASQPTSTIVRRLRVNPTTHDWLRLSWTCPWPSKICLCEWPISLPHTGTLYSYMSIRGRPTTSIASRPLPDVRANGHDWYGFVIEALRQLLINQKMPVPQRHQEKKNWSKSDSVLRRLFML